METPPVDIMRWIYISPHFDDAILSCGGLIWKQVQKGIPVEIWTICAGDAPPGPLSPLAVACHLQWGIESAEDIISARRLENQEAASLVGADTVNFSIPDCIYRQSATGELLYPEDVFAPIHPIEKDLDVDISTALESELKPDDFIVSPLAVGGHLDHVLTRLSLEKLERQIWYYADIPYLINNPEMLVPAAKGLKKTRFPISKTGLEVWRSAISAYATQILMLFGTSEKMQQAIREYWENQRGIFLWRS
jgi:LmbE family N-acetylglucosaminyl deacetylase